jgi:hypothetical protein
MHKFLSCESVDQVSIVIEDIEISVEVHYFSSTFSFIYLIPYIFVCPIAMQYGEDAAKTGQNRIAFCRFYTLTASYSLAR